jgi:hypothetical protein
MLHRSAAQAGKMETTVSIRSASVKSGSELDTQITCILYVLPQYVAEQLLWGKHRHALCVQADRSPEPMLQCSDIKLVVLFHMSKCNVRVKKFM